MSRRGPGAPARLRAAGWITGVALVGLAIPHAAEAPEAGRTYRLDPSTARVEFDLRATLHTVRGTAGEVAGTVATRRGEGGALELRGDVRISAASLDTGNRRRDRKMHGESLAVASHPEIVFEPARLTPLEDPSDPDRTHALSGALGIRGVTRDVSIPVRVSADDHGLAVEGETRIAWEDFGIPDPSAFLLRVKPTVTIRFRVLLVAVEPREP